MRRLSVTGERINMLKWCVFVGIQCLLTFKYFRNFIFDLGDLYCKDKFN